MHVSISEYVAQRPSTTKTWVRVFFGCAIFGLLVAYAFLPAGTVLGMFLALSSFYTAGSLLGMGNGIKQDAALREIYQTQRPSGLFLKVAAGVPEMKRLSWPRDPHLLSISSGRLELVGPLGTLSVPLESVQLRSGQSGKIKVVALMKPIEIHHPGGVVLIDTQILEPRGSTGAAPTNGPRILERLTAVFAEIVADQRALSTAQAPPNHYPLPQTPPNHYPPPQTPPSLW